MNRVRDATAFGPEPPQPQFGVNDPSGLVFDPAVPGDDCLNLDVRTPAPGATGLPVMVWSPGGSFRHDPRGVGAVRPGRRPRMAPVRPRAPATMRFDLTPSVVEDPYARERELWAGVR